MSGNTNRLPPPMHPPPPPRSRPSASAQRAHHAAASSDQVSPTGSSGAGASNQALRCAKCPDRRFPNQSRLTQHLATHSNKRPFVCKFPSSSGSGECGSAHNQQYDLNRHIREKHTDTERFKCEECGQILARNTTLQKHKCKKPSNTSRPCPECGVMLEKRSVLPHMREQHGVADPDKMPVFGVLKPDTSSSGAGASASHAPTTDTTTKKRPPLPMAASNQPAPKHRKKDDAATSRQASSQHRSSGGGSSGSVPRQSSHHSSGSSGSLHRQSSQHSSGSGGSRNDRASH
jgi:hypothetical protein